MSMTALENTVLTYSQTEYQQPNAWEVPGSTPFVTGNPVVDHFLNHMLVDHGIRVTVKQEPIFCEIQQVEVVDDIKAMWFLLKCS